MSGEVIAAMIGANSPAIIAGVQVRMVNDPSVMDMASSRAISSSAFSSQVVGFWLQGIQTDLSLGSTVAVEQSLAWLARLRVGQDLTFEDDMVMRVFDDISGEIVARLDDEAAVAEYARYRQRVHALISTTFPDASEV